MTPDQLRPLIQHYVSARLEEWEQSWYGGEAPGCETVGTARDDEGNPASDQWQEHLTAFLESDLTEYAKALRENTAERIAPVAREFIQRYKLSIEEGSPLYRQLCRELLKAEQRIADALIKRLQGDYRNDPVPPAPVPVPLIKSFPHAGPSLLLSQALTLYVEERNRNRASRSNDASAQALRRFLLIVGDKPLAEIEYAACFTYRQTLQRLPLNMAVRYPGKSVADVLALVEKGPPYARLADSTIKTQLTHVSTFFAWAKKRRHYSGENPITDLFPERVDEEPYDAFTEEDLRLIFGKEFTKQFEKDRLDRYWITLILLYTGMRREEAAQLLVSDVKQEGRIRFFDVAPDLAKGKSIKNKASRRRVPIHSHLEALGFLRYVEQMKREQQERLFPTLIKGRNSYGDRVGKWFRVHLERVGVRKPEEKSKKVMHSFRSTVSTRLVGVDSEICRLFIGHAAQDVHGKHYIKGQHVDLSKLKTAVECLDFRPFLSALPVYQPAKAPAKAKAEAKGLPKGGVVEG